MNIFSLPTLFSSPMFVSPMFASSKTSPKPMLVSPDTSPTLILKLITFLLFFLSFFKTIAQDFNEKEVEFWNLSHSFRLRGTLTTPKSGKNYPVAILISGSGQTDRDETIGKLKIFKTLAEYLSSNGVAVLRYDDRGGFKSEGPSTAKSTSLDLAQDVEAAVTFLKKSEKFNQIGLIGHSEGGGIAPVVASKMKEIKFLVALAGPGLSGKDVLVRQNKEIFMKSGVPEAHVDNYLNDFFLPALSLISENKDSTDKASELKSLGERYRKKHQGENFVLSMNTSEKNIPVFMNQLGSIWFQSFLKFDPIKYWKNTKCRTLALNGSLDVQVDAKTNIGAISALNKSNITTLVLPGLNHLFQEAKNGNVTEYASLNGTISDLTLSIVKNFILEK